MGEATFHSAAGSPATGRWVVSPCQWSLLRRIGLQVRPWCIWLRAHWPGGNGSSRRAGGRCSGGSANGVGHGSSGYGGTGHGETGCLAVPVVAA